VQDTVKQHREVERSPPGWPPPQAGDPPAPPVSHYGPRMCFGVGTSPSPLATAPVRTAAGAPGAPAEPGVPPSGPPAVVHRRDAPRPGLVRQASGPGLGSRPRVLASGPGLGSWPRVLVSVPASGPGFGPWPRVLVSVPASGPGFGSWPRVLVSVPVSGTLLRSGPDAGLGQERVAWQPGLAREV